MAGREVEKDEWLEWRGEEKKVWRNTKYHFAVFAAGEGLSSVVTTI